MVHISTSVSSFIYMVLISTTVSFIYGQTPGQVPERLVCQIASGFVQEVDTIDNEIPLRSSKFLKRLDRASSTKHESQSRKALEDEGLKVKMPVASLDIGLKKPFPWLKPSDLIAAMSEEQKLDACLCAGLGLDGLKRFWDNYRLLWPDHPIFEKMAAHNGKCAFVPIYLHADEGRYLKKEQILIINFQSALGHGTSLSQNDGSFELGQGVNILGSCFSTRFLIATLVSMHYRRKNRDGYRLNKLIEAITDDILEIYANGVSVKLNKKNVKLFVVPLGLKGDWPMLAKLGNLSRSFSRRGRPKPDSCICHLCLAGATDIPYHEHEINASWYSSYLQSRPWTTPSSLMRLPTPVPPETFYRFDIFHVCHKGIYAELAGSALVSFHGFISIFAREILARDHKCLSPRFFEHICFGCPPRLFSLIVDWLAPVSSHVH